MGKLTVELCPETGICSIVKANGTKIDLMPDEATELQQAGSPAALRAVLADVDAKFAAQLDDDELRQLAKSPG